MGKFYTQQKGAQKFIEDYWWVMILVLFGIIVYLINR